VFPAFRVELLREEGHEIRSMKPPHQPQLKLERETFTVSRELEYFTADELEKQTGYTPNRWWPAVIVKELVDNALDAAEGPGTAPEITVLYAAAKLEIRDNGGGMPAPIARKLADYSTRTADKLAYVAQAFYSAYPEPEPLARRLLEELRGGLRRE
jgi:signal transduction histidine kinase